MDCKFITHRTFGFLCCCKANVKRALARHKANTSSSGCSGANYAGRLSVILTLSYMNKSVPFIDHPGCNGYPYLRPTLSSMLLRVWSRKINQSLDFICTQSFKRKEKHLLQILLFQISYNCFSTNFRQYEGGLLFQGVFETADTPYTVWDHRRCERN